MKYKLPDNVTFDRTAGVYKWRNKNTGKRRSLGKNKDQAIDLANQLNDAVALKQASLASSKINPDIADVVSLYQTDEVPLKPWKKQTRKNYEAMLNRYKREFGNRKLLNTDRIFLGDWLIGLDTTADTYNGHRFLLIDIWRFAISRGFCEENEPEKTLKRSMSKKVAGNEKVRQRLDYEGFQAIHAVADDWLKNAMDLSLLTLQSRSEIVSMLTRDQRNDHLYVIRQKTEYQSDMAFIAIQINDELSALLDHCRRTPPISSHFISRTPKRHRYLRASGSVKPIYLSKAFSKARDQTGLWDDLEPLQRPSFHEIRSLGARMKKDAGIDKASIQALMTHTDRRATEIYLENPGSLTDSDFRVVTLA